ncbi:hypothetical protein BV20DRAFT_958350 [Pilatotrama ljubarskyi]|nr:hypothetical protein BV20DRAFT_958350 [Pilatotrama ljubarskyi]
MVSVPFNTPLVLAVALSLHGLRKRSLSPSGAAAAFCVGYTMLSVPLRTFGVALIVFYLAGSRATKVGKSLKKQLEEGHQDAGYRNAAQVLCNSLSAAVAALVWSALYEPNAWPSKVLDAANVPQIISAQKVPFDLDAWCPLMPTPAASWSRALLFVTLGDATALPPGAVETLVLEYSGVINFTDDLKHFACCLGDTLASELGILSRSPPILITTLKVVPPGTNGGLSKVGTLASLMGGFIMGGTIAASLLVQSSACRAVWMDVLPPLLLWGTLAGGLGSLLDSILGATLQRTRFINSTKRILTDEAPEPASGSDVKVVSGYDVLTNNQVNLVSSIATAVILGALA